MGFSVNDEIMFSLQKCEPSSSGTGGAGDPLFAGLCPGESASVGVVEDGFAEVTIGSGFIGGLNSFTLDIMVNSESRATISGGSYTVENLKSGDSVTLSYESSGAGKMNVTFIFTPEGTDTDTDDDLPMAGRSCVGVWTASLDCDNPSAPFGEMVFSGWKCKTSGQLPTKEVPTPFSNGWIPPVDLSQQEEYENDPDLIDPSNTLVYVAQNPDDKDCDAEPLGCGGLEEPDPPPPPGQDKFCLWCPNNPSCPD